MKKILFVLFCSLSFLVIPVRAALTNQTIQSALINKKSFVTNSDKNARSYLMFTTGNYLFKNSNNEDSIKQLFNTQLKTTNQTLINTPVLLESLKKVKSSTLNNRSWHTYKQTISGLPVFGSNFTARLKGDQVYSISSSYLTNTVIPASKLTKEQAEEIAINQAKIDYPEITSFKISSSESIVYNPFLLGLSENDENHLAQKITVVSTSIVPIGSTYIVDLSNGQILLSVPLIKNTLNRTVFNCSEYNPSQQSCKTRRTEGSPPVLPTVSITQNQANDINNAYDFFGNTYNFYFNSYNRDSYDNQGSPFEGFVNITTDMIQGFPCPNAAWNSEDNRMYLCEGMAANDVISHEISHAVTDYEINLIYSYQSGALSEAFSDIFAYGVDSDWTMGEDSVLGVIRNIDDPLKDSPPHPDRLFSQYYYCGPNDSGGVHRNNSIISKAFYLLVQGGDFNGCRLAPIGKDKSLLLFYSLIVSGHIQENSNFYSFYTGLAQTCSELQQDGVLTQSDCSNVERALQSIEIDQQPPMQQQGASCLQISRKTPLCTQTAQPTNTPTPTLTPTPTKEIQIPNCVCSGSPQKRICTETCKDRSNVTISGYACATDANCLTTHARTKGDNTGDGHTCLNDYTELLLSFLGKYPSGSEQALYSDFNGNGLIDDDDRSKFVENYVPNSCETNF